MYINYGKTSFKIDKIKFGILRLILMFRIELSKILISDFRSIPIVFFSEGRQLEI